VSVEVESNGAIEVRAVHPSTCFCQPTERFHSGQAERVSWSHRNDCKGGLGRLDKVRGCGIGATV